MQKGKSGDYPKVFRLVIGNPLIMREMVKHVPDAGSYAPVSILINERPDGVHLPYDRMASLLAPYETRKPLGSPRIWTQRLRPCLPQRRPNQSHWKPPNKLNDETDRGEKEQSHRARPSCLLISRTFCVGGDVPSAFTNDARPRPCSSSRSRICSIICASFLPVAIQLELRVPARCGECGA